MADKMMRIAGRDYENGVAKPMRVNGDGELSVENVLGAYDWLLNTDIPASETETLVIPYHQIPTGTAFVGVWVANNNTNALCNLTIEKAIANSFGQPSQYTSEIYKSVAGRGLQVIVPLITVDGSIRLHLENPTGSQHRYSARVVFYRHAAPYVFDGQPADVSVVFSGRYRITVPAGNEISQLAESMERWPEWYAAVEVAEEHDYSFSVILEQNTIGTSIPATTKTPIAERGVKGNLTTDRFLTTAPMIAPVIKNYSGKTQTYQVLFFGVR